MYFHLVCSPEFFAVASARKSARKVFRRSLELIVLEDHNFGRYFTTLPYAFHPCPFDLGKSLSIGEWARGMIRHHMGVVNPSHLRAQTLTLCSCEYARKSSNTMLTRPRSLGHSRFLSQLNDGSTQFNAYQKSCFGKGQNFVKKLGQNGQSSEARARSLFEVEP